MADLEYTVKVSGVEDVERLEKNLDNLHRTLNAGSGAGKSLEEMRKILVGMRGQASIIADLRDSVKSLNSAAENLGKGFESGFNRLDKTLKQGFQLTLDRVNMLGAEMSKGLSSGVKGAFDGGTQAAAAGGKRVASAIKSAGEEATSELAAWHAKDIKLNAKYATDLGVAQQQVLDKGTSTMVSSLRKRAEVIARLLQEEGTIGQEVAAKAYGTDFVNAVKAGLIGQQKLFEDHIQTVKKLGEAQVDAYVGKMNQQTVDRARAVAKEQLEANARAIKEELAAAADAFAKSPDTLANMQRFYTLQASVAQASTDRAREVARAQFQANSRAIKEELAAAAQAFASSPDTLANMQRFYTLQASVAQASTDRAREVARAQFQANSRAIKEELAAAAAAYAKSPDTLANMQKFYTLQASVAQASTDRAREVAKAQFQANSQAIKEELAAAAAAFAKSPDTLANMRKFYTMQESAAKYVEDRARKEAREAFAARSKAFKEEAAKFSESSYEAGMRQLASQYTDRGEIKAMEKLRVAADAVAVSKKNAAAAADPLRNALKGLTIDGNDTHSAMRGLASGFNLLWLTWGNLAPLFAGAAISNGFMQTAKQGMEVAHTLQTIATLGENSAQDMKSLTAELINLGNNGPYGPLQIAEAMKILSLAGLNAKEVLATTGTVMNFATSGTTDLKTAADVLVSVTTAFGTGAAGFERSADIITRAAADSKASVESFGEAMKTASVVGEQYKVTQEDLALNIQLLAQVGIEGTSAGTAVRNMYADITGRSGQVSKILRSLGLDFKNLDGSVVTTVEQMEMLYGVLKNYDAKSVGNILQAIYGERGAKAAIAALQAYKKEATDPKFANALEEQYEKIKNAAADSAIAAAFMGESSKKAFEAAAATLQTTMFAAFQNMEGELYLTALAFKKAFGDPETKALLEGMTSAVAQLGRLIAENLVPLANIAIAWGTYRAAVFAATTTLSGFLKVAGAVSPVLPAMGAALSGLTSMFGLSAGAANGAAKSTAVASSAIVGYSANITNGMASAAKSTASSSSAISGSIRGIASVAGSMAGNVLRALPVIGNVLSVAAIGWTLYKSAVDDARASADDFTGVRSENIIQKLNEEAKALNEVTRKRREGMSQTEAETELLYEKEVAQARADVSAELPKAKQEYQRLLAQFNDMSKTAYERGQVMLPMTLAGNKLRELETREQRLLDAQKNRKDAARAEQAQNLAEAKKQQEEMEKLFANGTKSWSLLDFQESQKDSFAKAGVMRDNELESLKSHFDAKLKTSKEFYDAEKKLLDQRNSANLISEQEYLASSMTLAIQHQTDQLAVLDKMQQEYGSASNARIEKLQSRQAAARGKAAEALVNAIKKEQQAAEISNNAFDVKRAEIAAEAYGRVGEVLNKVQADVGKLIETNKEFWDNRALEKEAVKAATAIDDKYRNMNTSIMSMDVAMYEFEKAQHASLVQSNKQNDALRRQLVIQKDLVMLMKSALEARIAAGGSTIEEVAAYKDAIWTLEDGVSKLESQLTESTAKGLEDGAKAGMDAFAKARKEQFDKLAEELASAVTDGLMSGDYKSIGKSIRDTLQRELIRKPLQAWIQAEVGSVLGGVSAQSAAGSGGLTGSGSGLDFTNLSGSFGGTIASIGSKFGFQAAESFGMGLQGINLDNAISGTYGGTAYNLGSTIGGWDASISEIPGFEGGFGSVLGYGKAIYDLTEGNYGSAVGTAIGTYILPGIGTMIGSTLGSLFDGGSPYYGGDAVSVGGKQSWTGKQGGGYDSGIGNFFGSYAQGISAAMTGILQDEILVKIGFDENEKRARAYLDLYDTAGNIAVTRSGVSVAKGEAGAKETVDLVVKEAFTALLADDRLATYEKQIIAAASAAGATYENLISAYTQINAVNVAFSGLATTMTMFVGISDDMKAALLNGLGGIEGLSQSTQAYYENFYTEAERLTIAGRNMNQVMQSLGLDIDVMQGDLAKEAFRRSVEAAFEAGNGSLAASLLGVSGQFAEIADAAQAASDNLSTAEGAINSYAEALANLAEKAGYLGSTNRYAAENAAGTIQSLFADIGIEKDVTALTSSILDATTADVEDFFRELWPMMQTDAARDELIKVSDAMLDIAARSHELSLSLATLQERLGDTSAIRNFNLDTVTADLVSFGKTLGQSLDFESVRAEIASANKESVKAYFNDVWQGLDTTEAQQKFIGITNSILDVVEASEELAEDFRAQAESLWNDQIEAARNVVEAQIDLHEREAAAIRERITETERLLNEWKSDRDYFVLKAGRNAGQPGVPSSPTLSLGLASTWEEYAASMGYMADLTDDMVSEQQALLDELKKEESRHTESIKNLQGIITESQKQTNQLMSLNEAINLLRTDSETGIQKIVDALSNKAATSSADSVVKDATSSVAVVTGDPVKDSYNSIIKVLKDQRGNAVSALAGDETAATNFFDAMHEAGITMFDDVANHSIQIYDKEIERLQGVVDGMKTHVPKTVDQYTAPTGTGSVNLAPTVSGWELDKVTLMQFLGKVIEIPSLEASLGPTIKEIGGKYGDKVDDLLKAYIPAYSELYNSIVGSNKGSATSTATGSDTPSGDKTLESESGLTRAEWEIFDSLNMEYLRLTKGDAEVKKAQIAALGKPELQDAQRTVWAQEILNSVDDQMKGLEEVGQLTSIKEGVSELITSLTAIGSSSVHQLEDSITKVNELGAAQLSKAREELYNQLLPEQETTKLKLGELSTAFADLGFEMPTTAQGFRAILDSLADGDLRDSLLELVPAFTALGYAAETVEDAYARLKQTFVTSEDIAKERISLEERLFEATATTAEKAAKARDAIDDYNKSLYDQVVAVENLQAAAEKAVAKVGEAWASVGTASAWAAEHLKDSSGLEFQLDVVRRSLANMTDVQEREAAIGKIIELEKSIFDVEQSRIEEQNKLIDKQLEADREKLANAEELLEAAKRLKEYATNLMTGPESGLSKVDQLAAKRSEYEDLLAKAQTGDVDAIASIERVAGDYLGLANELSTSQTDYSYLAGKTAAELLTLSTIQEASAQSQIDQLKAIIETSEEQLRVSQREFSLSLETKALIEQQLADAKTQFLVETENMNTILGELSAANGLLSISNELLTALPQELAGVLGPMISSAISAAAAAAARPMVSTSSGSVVSGTSSSHSVSGGGTSSSSALQAYLTQQRATTPTFGSSSVMQSAISAKEAQARISGSHSTGLAYVPYDGYIAELHKGERVLTAAETKVYTPPEGATISGLISEIRALRAQVAKLEEASSKTAKNTEKLPRMADQVDEVADGGFVRTRAVA